MVNVIKICDDDDAAIAIKADRLCRRLGAMLQKHYPGIRWYVDVNLNGGVANIRCADIAMSFGSYLHLHCSEIDLERRVIAAGGEILERFAVSRERQSVRDISHIVKNARGDAVLAKAGGY